MNFPQTFVPTAHEVGLLPMVTELFFVIAMFSFAAGFVFFLSSRHSVAPWHRTSAGLSAVICLVAAASYAFIRYYYHDMLHQIALMAPDPGGKKRVIHDAFFAIGQYRYMDWAVTTPLLLLKMVLTLKVKPREIMGWIALLLGADFWMVLAGSIGDQQFSPVDGTLLVGRHLLWGTLSTLGYARHSLRAVRAPGTALRRAVRRRERPRLPADGADDRDDLGRVSVGLPGAGAVPARRT